MDVERLQEENAYLKSLLNGDTLVKPAWNLTSAETRIMSLLLQRNPCPKSTLIEAVYWDREEPTAPDNMIEAYVSRLRRKVAKFGYEIKNMRDIGYIMSRRKKSFYVVPFDCIRRY